MKKTFQEFIRELLARFGENERIVIVVDGFGGAGKSTFVAKLCEHIPNAGIVCVDHFYQPLTPEGEHEFHWDRFEEEVVEQLRKREAIRYAPYSWKDRAFLDDISLQKDQPVIVEGVYTSQEKYRDAYALTMLLGILARGETTTRLRTVGRLGKGGLEKDMLRETALCRAGPRTRRKALRRVWSKCRPVFRCTTVRGITFSAK